MSISRGTSRNKGRGARKVSVRKKSQSRGSFATVGELSGEESGCSAHPTTGSPLLSKGTLQE